MSCVYMLHVKTLHRVISRRSRRVVAKKCTRKRDVRGELLFCLYIKPISVFEVLVAVVAKAP